MTGAKHIHDVLPVADLGQNLAVCVCFAVGGGGGGKLISGPHVQVLFESTSSSFF